MQENNACVYHINDIKGEIYFHVQKRVKHSHASTSLGFELLLGLNTNIAIHKSIRLLKKKIHNYLGTSSHCYDYS